jgi:hypothetical protein
MLVHAALLVQQGLDPGAACAMAVADALSDEPDVQQALHAALDASF